LRICNLPPRFCTSRRRRLAIALGDADQSRTAAGSPRQANRQTTRRRPAFPATRRTAHPAGRCRSRGMDDSLRERSLRAGLSGLLVGPDMEIPCDATLGQAVTDYVDAGDLNASSGTTTAPSSTTWPAGSARACHRRAGRRRTRRMARPWPRRPWAGDVKPRLPWTCRLTPCGFPVTGSAPA
jgi:hypothetical protein